MIGRELFETGLKTRREVVATCAVGRTVAVVNG